MVTIIYNWQVKSDEHERGRMERKRSTSKRWIDCLGRICDGCEWRVIEEDGVRSHAAPIPSELGEGQEEEEEEMTSDGRVKLTPTTYFT
jgi:hypothetical protein